MNLADITPLVLTWNEEPNIQRCLERLTWADRVLVIDSGSTDQTLGICAKFPNVDVIYRKFDNHTNQWNHGLDQVASSWVLSLDADYLISESLIEEIKNVDNSPSQKAWFANFFLIVAGKRLRGSLYPPRILLFERSACRYISDGHTQLLEVNGACDHFTSTVDHDDRKPLFRWLASQAKYASLEAEKLLSEPHPAGWPDRLRKMIWPAAPAAFLYTLFAKRVIFDGWPGLFYVFQRTYAELLLSLELLERKFDPDKN